MTINSYKSAAEKITWQNQKEMYQQGHEFFLNYCQLYEANKNNDIGQFLEMHYALVQNYKQKGKIQAVDDKSYTNLLALVQAQIRTLERILPKMNKEQAVIVSAKLRTLKRIENKTQTQTSQGL